MVETPNGSRLKAGMTPSPRSMGRGSAGFSTYGHSIGIIMLNCGFVRPPGDMGNATTFDFPVLYRVVTEVEVETVLTSREERHIIPFIQAARDLEARGVKAITTSCGTLALHQRRLASAVRVPLFASTLIQVPLVYEMLGRRGKVGILAADATLLSDDHYEAVGWSAKDIPIALGSMDDAVEFPKLMDQTANPDRSVEVTTIESEVRQAICRLIANEPEVRAIVVECTNLVPYASVMQQETGLPVFDIVTLTKMVHETVVRRPYGGYL